MPYKPREIEGMLIKKLKMLPDEADHKWLRLDVAGLPPIRTKLPHHKDDIRDKLVSRLHNQLRVRKAFFHELMDCTKQYDDYERQIRTDPYPPFNILFV